MVAPAITALVTEFRTVPVMVPLPSVNVFSASDAAPRAVTIELLAEMLKDLVLDRRELRVRDAAGCIGDRAVGEVVMRVGVLGDGQRHGFARLPARARDGHRLSGPVVLTIGLHGRVPVILTGRGAAAGDESQVVRLQPAGDPAGARH